MIVKGLVTLIEEIGKGSPDPHLRLQPPLSSASLLHAVLGTAGVYKRWKLTEGGI